MNRLCRLDVMNSILIDFNTCKPSIFVMFVIGLDLCIYEWDRALSK